MTRDQLLERIVKGAAFIENLSPTDARYDRAMKRYDDYVSQLLALDRPNWYVAQSCEGLEKCRALIRELKSGKKVAK